MLVSKSADGATVEVWGSKPDAPKPKPGGGVCDEGEGNQGMGSNLRSMSFLFPVFFSFLLILLGRSFLYPEKYVAG